MNHSILKILPVILMLNFVGCFGPSSMEADGESKSSLSSKSEVDDLGESSNSFSEVCKYDNKIYTDVQGYINCMIDGNQQSASLIMQCDGFNYDLHNPNDASSYINCKIDEALANVPPQTPFSKECDGTMYSDPDQWAQCVEDLLAQNQNPPPGGTPPETPAPPPPPNQGNTSCKIEGKKKLGVLFYDCKNGALNRNKCKYECKLTPCKKVEKYFTADVGGAFDLFAIGHKWCQAKSSFPGDPRGTQCNAQCKK